MPAKTAQPAKLPKPAAPLSAPPLLPAPPVGSLRTGLKQFTRQRMLDAALQCFCLHGYQETTVEKIAELAGTTVPTFYRHFPSKRDLLHPLMAHLTTEVAATLRELDGCDVRDRRAVRRWLDSYMVMWGRVHKLCAAHWEATNCDDAYAERLMDDAVGCASTMEHTIAQIEAEEQGRFKIRIGLMTMFLDRMAVVVSAERDAGRAQQILDEMSKILWVILNNDPALDI